jgi:hypothetical protein
VFSTKILGAFVIFAVLAAFVIFAVLAAFVIFAVLAAFPTHLIVLVSVLIIINGKKVK